MNTIDEIIDDTDHQTGETLNPPRIIAYSSKADPAAAQRVIDTVPDPKSRDTRSEWLWVRLSNGDLMLATFPHGDTYLETESDPNRP